MERRDFQSLPDSHLPDDLKDTGGIMYVPSNPPAVWISDNVHPDDKPFWAGHEWECMASPDINTCLTVTKRELETVKEEKGETFYTEYIARRARMLNGALRFTLKNLKIDDGEEEGGAVANKGTVHSIRTILKIGGSLKYLQSLCGEKAVKIIGDDILQNLGRKDEIFERYAHLIITK